MKIISFDSAICRNLEQGLRREWLETNQFSGYASSTILGANTRRQHGLLVAQLKPPLGRYMLLSSVEEILYIDDVAYPLSTQLYGDSVCPDGYRNLSEFNLLPFPTWVYRVEDIVLTKSIIFLNEEQTVIIRYQLVEGDDTLVRLEVKPLTAFRHVQDLTYQNGRLSTELGVSSNRVRFAGLYFHHDAAILDQSGSWYCRVYYPEEKCQGLDFEEDLYAPFRLVYTFSEDREVFLCTSLEDREVVPFSELVLKEEERRYRLLKDIHIHDPRFQILAYSGRTFLASPFKADSSSFLLSKENGSSVSDDVLREFLSANGTIHDRFTMKDEQDRSKIILKTSYHSDFDQARDQLIGLHGLALTTKQYQIARHVLAYYANRLERGLLPNRRGKDEDDYGAVDAPLWLIHSAFEYLTYSQDREFVEQNLFPALNSVIEAYIKGTDFNIQVSSDGLVSGGTSKKALTWMDAQIGNWVVTPREGKAVEIQALWYNALMAMVQMAEWFGKTTLTHVCKSLAERAKDSFNRTFWNPKSGYLYDCVEGNRKDGTLRPNQLLALGLPFPILNPSPEKWRSVLDVTRQHLLTPYGMRTLAPYEANYSKTCEGDGFRRSRAYHQGTVWTWLLIPFVSALLRTSDDPKRAKEEFSTYIQPLVKHLEDRGLGFISEFFDGDPPHEARGGIAQVLGGGAVLQLYEILS
ncbi:MAG: glycogen debranching enzyme N-terminal domain-containing protein [Candidatus Omnitrophica bacterium]|nr:glycogen debranching enzyme N-terminal domain-containing protein [Candidatus Omnitrophota bacterium]